MNAVRVSEAWSLYRREGAEALNNPHAMIGRTCMCRDCFCCAALAVYKAVTTPYSIDDIKDCNRQAGKKFFSDENMRFGKSRVSDKVYQGAGGIFFVTSELDFFDMRRYAVRQFEPETGAVATVGSWHGLTRSVAHGAAKMLAAH